jgi:GT2 family glycosyltransferase
VIDVVMISNDARPDLLLQSVNTLFMHGDRSQFTLTIVHDVKDKGEPRAHPQYLATEIMPHEHVGASRARNIGAGSIPKYRRGDYVLFLDDDVYCCPGWDKALLDCYDRAHSTIAPLPNGCVGWMREKANRIISGYSHPFNNCEKRAGWGEPLVISSVAMMMPWAIFDEVGPWDEPGGRGASEDYAMCMRARDKGYGFAVTEPQCIIHTGLKSNDGQEIVGYHELQNQNNALIQQYGLEGKVRMAL